MHARPRGIYDAGTDEHNSLAYNSAIQDTSMVMTQAVTQGIARNVIEWADRSKWLLVPQQERSRKTLTKVIDAAISLFSEKGFDGTSIGDISKLAHVSVGAIYARFADKDAILYAVLDSYYRTRFAQLEEIVRPYRAADETADDVLRLYVNIMVSAFRTDRRLLGVAELRRLTDTIVAQQAARANAHLADVFAALLAPHAESLGHPNIIAEAHFLHNIIRNTFVLATLHDISPVGSALTLDSPSFEAELYNLAARYLRLDAASVAGPAAGRRKAKPTTGARAKAGATRLRGGGGKNKPRS